VEDLPKEPQRVLRTLGLSTLSKRNCLRGGGVTDRKEVVELTNAMEEITLKSLSLNYMG